MVDNVIMIKQKSLTVPCRSGKTLFDFPAHYNLADLMADIAILGLPYGSPYSMDESVNDQSNAPMAIRESSEWACRSLRRWDFDLGGTVLNGEDINIVDCGDVPADPADPQAHYQDAEQAAKNIISAGAMLISLGGDHGVPIPVFRALEDKGPVHLIQLDAHIDWRDHRNGVREGYSSTIRRASEMSHIDRIFQVGLRSQGSARAKEFEAARAYGAELISAAELHDSGVEAVLQRIPEGQAYYITIDADGLDPSVMPAVAGPAPGGISYYQACKMIKGLVNKGRVLGMDIVEITPSRDINNISSLTAGRLIINLIGSAVRAGYFKSL